MTPTVMPKQNPGGGGRRGKKAQKASTPKAPRKSTKKAAQIPSKQKVKPSIKKHKGANTKRANTKGDAAQAALNRCRAFDLRAKKKSFRKIAEILQVDVKTAHQYIMDYWAELEAATREQAKMLLHVELGTLDEMEEKWLPIATAAKLDISTFKDGANGPVHIEIADYEAGIRAAAIVLKIQERRAKLLGLDKPEKVEHSGEVSVHLTRDEWKKRMQEARE